MNIRLGNLTFDGGHTAVRESYEEVGGRDARKIELNGLILGERVIEAIESRLDDIMRSASEKEYATEFIVRAGRRALVRRLKFTREIARDSMVGRFSLTLEAREPFDEAVAATSLAWSITECGASTALNTCGNLAAPVSIALTADGALIEPCISDGVNSIAYSGSMAQGDVLIFDAASGKVLLNGVDVTPYTTAAPAGTWPQAIPGSNALSYTDGAGSSHLAQAVVSYRDRWW